MLDPEQILQTTQPDERIPIPRPVTVAEAARRCGVSEPSIRSKIARKEIATEWVGGRMHIPIAELRRVYKAGYKES